MTACFLIAFRGLKKIVRYSVYSQHFLNNFPMRISKIVLFFLFLDVFAPTSSFSAVLPHNVTHVVQTNPTPKRLSVRALWKAVKKKKKNELALVIIGSIFILIALLAFLLIASINARSSRNSAATASGGGNKSSGFAIVVLLTGGQIGRAHV